MSYLFHKYDVINIAAILHRYESSFERTWTVYILSMGRTWSNKPGHKFDIKKDITRCKDLQGLPHTANDLTCWSRDGKE